MPDRAPANTTRRGALWTVLANTDEGESIVALPPPGRLSSAVQGLPVL